MRFSWRWGSGYLTYKDVSSTSFSLIIVKEKNGSELTIEERKGRLSWESLLTIQQDLKRNKTSFPVSLLGRAAVARFIARSAKRVKRFCNICPAVRVNIYARLARPHSRNKPKFIARNYLAKLSRRNFNKAKYFLSLF